jgi:Electron transfer DM13
MVAHIGSWFTRWKWVLVAVGLVALIGAWWVFRPEKLWINQKVDEPAAFASSTDPQPLYTGRLDGKAHPTSGRATIYKTADGKQYLRLTDFSTSNGPDVHVVLAQSSDQNLTKEFVKGDLDSFELGSMKANQGDQNYDLPDSADLNRYDDVVIYCERFNVVFGSAKLAKF